MVTFAVNMSTIFTEVPFIERFKKAKDAGFSLWNVNFLMKSRSGASSVF